MTDRFRQVIPRPAGFRSGGIAPWAASPDAINPSLEEVSAILDPIEVPDSGSENVSAVLLPLIARPNGLSLIFIRRAATVGRDPLHVAFPGGHRDGDETLLTTALRETEEEIGLGRRSITVLGSLPATATPPSATAMNVTVVVPFVGLVEGDPIFAPNPDEVEAVFEIPLLALYDGEISWVELWTRGEIEHEVHFFADDAIFGDDILWGFSARVVWELLDRIWIARVSR